MLKKIIIAIFMVTVVLFACAAGGKSDKNVNAKKPETGGNSPANTSAKGVSPSGTTAAPKAKNGADPDTSYAFGVVLGTDLKQTGLQFDYDEFIKGFSDSLEGNTPRISSDEAIAIIQGAFTAVMAIRAEENLQKETVFLAENGAKPGVYTTASGLQYEVIVEGTGPKPGVDSMVEVHYEGAFLDGTVFDSSYVRNEPARFSLEGVIPGWAEGIILMSQGSTYRLFIPSALAYGERGAGSTIPPNSALIFKVELLSILD
ncbi:MAG: FKBP-type peptidyl-prolyl cis-trans isomerase [Spirochaetaceae bacterium]|jgi:FKBP-type peptidyl-prolyl cis-trans isomerase FkpA|nr:FKBP-type peptidyl-prolyl cis-trans isomerase [Spirochaetaceae bacterium]